MTLLLLLLLLLLEVHRLLWLRLCGEHLQLWLLIHASVRWEQGCC